MPHLKGEEIIGIITIWLKIEQNQIGLTRGGLMKIYQESSRKKMLKRLMSFLEELWN